MFHHRDYDIFYTCYMKWISIKHWLVPIYKYSKYICDECTSKQYTIIRKGIHGNLMDINYISTFALGGSIGPTLLSGNLRISQICDKHTFKLYMLHEKVLMVNISIWLHELTIGLPSNACTKSSSTKKSLTYWERYHVFTSWKGRQLLLDVLQNHRPQKSPSYSDGNANYHYIVISGETNYCHDWSYNN